MAAPFPSNPTITNPFAGGVGIPQPPALPMQMPTFSMQQQPLPMPGDYNGMGQGVRQALSYYLLGGMQGYNPYSSMPFNPQSNPNYQDYPTQQPYQNAAPQAPAPTSKSANQSYSSSGSTTDYQAQATSYAQQYGLDPQIFTKQIQQESGFDPSAVSPAGAIGIAQFMPATAQGMGVDPYNPSQSLDGAARLMAGYLKQYNGSYPLALAAYNAGPGNVQRYLNGTSDLPAETKRYIQAITGQSP